MSRLLVIACCCTVAAVQAQIRTDGSLGRPAQSLNGPAYVVPQSLGQLAGSNLFHSFQAFNLATGESANFTTATPGIANVISRVTGGSPSQINGLLKLTAVDGTPGFFFINPAGVTFGAGAAIDVPGAFHVSTANYLKFPDGRWYADPARASSFSNAAPEAFGFLGSSRATLTVQGGALLVPHRGQTLALVAGDVLVDNAALGSGAGAIRIAAVGAEAVEPGLAGALPAGAGRVDVRNGATVTTSAVDALPGAHISIAAADLQIDNGGNLYSTGNAKDTGAGGDITLALRGQLAVTGGGSISTDTSGSGASGAIRIQAGQVQLSGGSYIITSTAGAGDAGAITVAAGSVKLDSKSYLGSLALQGQGRAGRVDVQATGDVAVANGASIFSSTVSAGQASAVILSAANLLLDGGSVSSNSATSTSAAGRVPDSTGGASGSVEVAVAGRLTLQNQSAIDTSTLTAGAAGSVRVRAGDLLLDGGSRISSSALAGSGAAGALDIAASGQLALRNQATLSTASGTTGDAGAVRVSAGALLLDSGASIDSTAGLGSSGRGGNVAVNVSGALALQQGAHISASTAGAGSAGGVQINAGSLALDTRAYVSTASSSTGQGKAGNVDVSTAGDVGLRNGAFINSDTLGGGDAGTVNLQARNISLDSAGRISSVAFTGSSGQAGRINVQARGDLVLAGSSGQDGQSGQSGQISTSTFASGNGGAVSVRAANVRIDGPGAGIASFAQAGSTGHAGSIDVVASGAVLIREGGLSSSTVAAGAAGDVRVQAAQVVVDGAGSQGAAGISAAASAGSSGQTGHVQVLASERITLANGGFVSIGNAATVSNPAARVPSTLQLAAPQIVLQDAQVSAASGGNVAASTVAVQASQRLSLLRSSISTSANDGDGGALSVQGGQVLALRQSQITTSVLGAQGNGGDIAVNAGALVLDSGFIQANTAARNASGGLVSVTTGSLVASGNTLLLGGNTAYSFQPQVPGFNVVQAAAPSGVSGVVAVTSPVLDVTGSLRGLSAEVVDTGGLGRSLCRATGGSSLAVAGRGGLAPLARGLLRAERPGPQPSASTAWLPAPPANPGTANGLLAGRGAGLVARGCW